MASETVDPIDWSHPPPYTGQYPLSSTLHSAMRAGLQITRLAALSQPRTCDLQNARPMHCRCGHSGYVLCCFYRKQMENIKTKIHDSLGNSIHYKMFVSTWNNLGQKLWEKIISCSQSIIFQEKGKMHKNTTILTTYV